MKKIILLLVVLLPLAASAKFYKGKIFLKNDSKLDVYLEVPYSNSKELVYKSSKKGSVETFDIDFVKSFEYIDEDNNTIRYITAYLESTSLLNVLNLTKDDEKSWVCIVKEGSISLYMSNTEVKSFDGIEHIKRYYYMKGHDNNLHFLFREAKGIVIGDRYWQLKMSLKSYFEKECPRFVEAVKSTDIKKNELGIIVDLYESCCGDEKDEKE